MVTDTVTEDSLQILKDTRNERIYARARNEAATWRREENIWRRRFNQSEVTDQETLEHLTYRKAMIEHLLDVGLLTYSTWAGIGS